MDDMRHFFPGSNTSRGFYNRFASIMPTEQVRRKIILKGGPGVGKNTFMNLIAEHLMSLGRTIEFFHCSSDPDSLDGIAAPEIGFVLIDGTAPHVVDPIEPGASDGILNLGDFLNEAKLEKSRRQIVEISEQITRHFLQAYDYLGAAAPLFSGISRQFRDCTPPGAVDALARKLINRFLPDGDGIAAERALFSEAFTPQGHKSLLPTLLTERMIELATPWGFSLHGLLQKIKEAAFDRGIRVIGLYNPLVPDELSHLIFPGLSLCIVSRPVENPTEVLDLAEEISLKDDLVELVAFNRDAHDRLIARATRSLREAKLRHDDLEKLYVAAMDYDSWNLALDKVKTTVGML